MPHQIERKLLVIPIFLLMFLLFFQIQTVFSFNNNSSDAHTETDNTSLSIWSTSDNGEVGPNVNVTFYANYTNKTSGEEITGSNVYCQIKFYFDSLTENMTYNSSSNLYEYVRDFPDEGNYTYNVTCDGSPQGYDKLSLNETAEIKNQKSYLTLNDSSKYSLVLPESTEYFYARYFDLNGDPITGDGVYCEIKINDSDWIQMTYNSTIEEYQYSTNFTNPGRYQYWVFCNGTAKGFSNQNKTEYSIVDVYPKVKWLFPEFVKRKKIIVESSYSSDLQNYQVLLNFTKPHEMSCDAIRVSYYAFNYTNGNETELKYYVQNCSSNVLLWVKLPKMVEGNNTLFVYYDNITYVSDKSNASEVFEFFDDFENGIDWTFSGNANWGQNSTYIYHGNYSAKSGTIGDSQYSAMSKQVTLDGLSVIVFHWKVSSEQNGDFLRFSVDGTEKDSISGEVDWTEKEFEIGSGTHTIAFNYTKSAADSSGEDAGFVDYIYIRRNETIPTIYYLDSEEREEKVFNYYKTNYGFANLGKENTLIVGVRHPVCDIVSVRLNITDNTGYNVCENCQAVFDKSSNGYCYYNYSFNVPNDGNKIGRWNVSILANDSYGLSETSEYFFKVKKVNVTLNLNSSKVNPGDVVEYYGHVSLFPDNENVTNNEFETFVDGKAISASGLIDFKYKRKISIHNNSNTNLTHYQMNISVDTASLISQGKMNPDCSDIRFSYYNTTEKIETKIPYWIESGCNTNNTIIWIKVPYIPANGNATVYMYYGNKTPVTSESNGDAVFLLFDDFNGDSLNTSKWVEKTMPNGAGSGSYSVSNSIFDLVGPSNFVSGGLGLGIFSKTLFGPGTKIVALVTKEANKNGRTTDLGFSSGNPSNWVCIDNNNYAGYLGGSSSGSNGPRSCHVQNCVGGSCNGIDIVCFTTPVIMEIIKESSTTTVKINGTSYSNSENVPGSGYVSIWSGGGYADQGYHPEIAVDWVFVAKYTDPEPTYSIGEELLSSSTDSNGNFNCTLQAPTTLGLHTIKVNLTDPNGIYGENQTTFEVVSGNLTSPSISVSNESVEKTHNLTLSCGIYCDGENCTDVKIYPEIKYNGTWIQIPFEGDEYGFLANESYFACGKVNANTSCNHTWSIMGNLGGDYQLRCIYEEDAIPSEGYSVINQTVSSEQNVSVYTSYPPVIELLRNYNSDLTAYRDQATYGETIRVRINVSDVEWANDIQSVLVNITNTTGYNKVENGVATEISSEGKNWKLFEYNYTLPTDHNEKGLWNITVWVNDSGGLYNISVYTFRLDDIYCDEGKTDDVCLINSTENVTGLNISGDRLIIGEAGNVFTDQLKFVNIQFNEIEVYGKIEGNVNITTNNLTITSSGSISASEKGYKGGYGAQSGQGPGGGDYSNTWYKPNDGGGGASYGGLGGINSYVDQSPAYGNLTWPTDYGSGGGGGEDKSKVSGGDGGGVIFINASYLYVDGSINSNGGNGGVYSGDSSYYHTGGGGGSGGSILIITDNLEGSGSISADGGSGGKTSSVCAGGGGGGRIAIYYNHNNFNGDITAYGGDSNCQRGGAGTIVFTKWMELNKPILINYSYNVSKFTNPQSIRYEFNTQDDSEVIKFTPEIKYPNETIVNYTLYPDIVLSEQYSINQNWTLILNYTSEDGNYTLTKVYFKDFFDNWNSTELNDVITIDAIPPNYTSFGYDHEGYDSVIRAKDNITFYSLWQDYSPNYNAKLSNWIFSWNGTCDGQWVNETYNFTENPQWANITKTLSSCLENKTIGFRFYANDSVNHWNYTPIQTFYVNYSSNLTSWINDVDGHYDVDDILDGENIVADANYTTASGLTIDNATVLINLTAPNGSLIVENEQMNEQSNYYETSFNDSIIKDLGKYNYTIVASKDGYPTREVKGEFYVENVTLSVNLGSYILKPNQTSFVYGHASLKPYDENVSNVGVTAYLDGEPIISNNYFSNYKYKKRIDIYEHSGNNLTHYQMNISVDTASLISQGKMNPDCSDIRFSYYNTTEKIETKIPYWIESGCNTNNTIIWIKVPYIPANGNATVYMYYGNKTPVTSESNADDVFLFFDDFEGTSLNTSKWNEVVSSGTISVNNGELFISHTSVDSKSTGIYTKNSFPVGYGISMIVRYKDVSGTRWHKTHCTLSQNNDYSSSTYFDVRGSGLNVYNYGKDAVNRNYQIGFNDGSNSEDFTTNIPKDGNYHLFNLIIFSNLTMEIITEDDGQVYKPSSVGSLPASSFYIALGTRTVTADDKASKMYVDYVMLKRYTSPEPTYSIGEELLSSSTDSNGNFNYTFTAPSTLGLHTIKVNLTDPNGIYGENQTTFEVRLPAYIQKIYNATPNYTSNPNCAIYSIILGNYRSNTTDELLYGSFSTTIDGVKKDCTGLGNCTVTFTVGSSCDITPGNKTVYVHVTNDTSYYWTLDDSFQYYFQSKTTTGSLTAYNITVFNVSRVSDKIARANVSITNTGTGTMKDINITLYLDANNQPDTAFSDFTEVVNDTVIHDLLPGESENVTFNITIPAGTQPGDYYERWQATWTDNNGETHERIWTNAYAHVITVVGNPQLELSTYNITTSVSHGSSYEINITINSTGNSPLEDVWANYSSITMPESWITITPNHWSSISDGSTENFTVEISVPSGTSPGLYRGIINVTNHVGHLDERYKEIEVNVTVPTDSRWYLVIHSKNGTEVEEINETYPLNTPDYLGNITVVNLGNIPLNFSIEYNEIVNYAIDDGVFVKNYNGCNPDFVYVDKISQSTICLYQKGFSHSRNYGLNITFTNQSGTPETNYTEVYWSIVDQPPFINNLTYVDRIEINKKEYSAAYYDDDEEKLVKIYLNITLPNSTIDNVTCAQGSYLSDGEYECDYYPPIPGFYKVNLTACDGGGKCRTVEYNFTAYDKTHLSVESDKDSLHVTGVTYTNGQTFSLNMTVRNLDDVVSAYSVNVTSDPPAGTSWGVDVCHLGTIAPNTSKSCLLNFTVPPATTAKTYSIQPYVKWQQANKSLTGVNYTDNPVYIIVDPTKIIEVHPNQTHLYVNHGESNSTWFIINSTGNDEVNSIDIVCQQSPDLCPYLSFSPNHISSIGVGSSENVSVTVSPPLGFSPGYYYPNITASSPENTEDSFILTVYVPENSSWITDRENNTIIAVAGKNDTVEAVNIKNIGNVKLDFDFHLYGNATSWLTLNENHRTINPQENYTLMLNYTTPDNTSVWTADLTIHENNYGQSKNVSIIFKVYKAELFLNAPNETNKQIDVESGRTMTMNATLTLAGEKITNETEFEAFIDDDECSIDYVSLDTYGNWIIDCVLPNETDGRWHNVTLKAHYLPYDMWVDDFESNSVYYKDVTPPTIESVDSPSIVYGNNETINVDVVDNVAVDKVWMKVDQLNKTYTLNKTGNKTWSITLENLTIGDYDLHIFANDTTKNVISTYGYFEVYEPREINGTIVDAANQPVHLTFYWYRNGTGQLLHQIVSTTDKGQYQGEIHKRSYDLKFSVFDTIEKIYDINATTLPNDFIKIDEIAPAETNLVNSLNGIAFNTTLDNEANIRIYYDQSALVSYGLSEDYLKVFYCNDWIWNQRSCNSSNNWVEIQNFDLNKLYNYIDFNVTHFSSSTTGYVAYVIAEKKPPSQADITIYDVQPLTVQHNTNTTLNITIKSSGTETLLNTKIDCISGTLCHDFDPQYLRYVGNLLSGDEAVARINLTIPNGYPPGNYYGVIRVSADNTNFKDKTVEVVVLENRSWSINNDTIYKEVGIGYGKLFDLNITNNGNVENDFEFDYPDHFSGPDELTVEKLDSHTAEIYYNTTGLTPGIYTGLLNITGKLNSDPLERSVNLTIKVVNFTLDLINPIEQINTTINSTVELKVKAWYEENLINSTSDISFSLKLNQLSVPIDSISYNSTSETFDIKFTVPVTKYNNTLYIFAQLKNEGYTTELIKQNFILVNDTMKPEINETQAIVLENKTLIEANAWDNDQIKEVKAVLKYPNGTTLDIPLEKSGENYIANVSTSLEGDYEVNLIAKDGFNNTHNKTMWFRVAPMVYITGNAPIETKISLYKPVVNYKFKEESVSQSFNVSLRAGNYDMNVEIPDEAISITLENATINKSLDQAIEEDIFPVSIVNPGLTKEKFRAISFKPKMNFSSAKVCFNFLSYVDEIKNLDDLRIYHCHDWDTNNRECLGNWTQLNTSIDKRNFIACSNVSSFSAFTFAESVVCGNGVCESDYGETHDNCPQDCPAQPVCGNGVCELGENWQNCPSDCPKPKYSSSTAYVSSSSQSLNVEELVKEILKELEEVPKENITLSRKSLDVELYQGETLETKIQVDNNMDSDAVVTLEAKGGIKNVTYFKNGRISLGPHESSYVTITFKVPYETFPGIYNGEIVITYNDRIAYLPVNLRVLSVKRDLLDLKVNLLSDTVAPGYALPVEVTLYNMGRLPKTDVNLTIMVFDFEKGEVVNTYRETLAVETSLSRVFYIKIPKDVPEGKYMVKAIGRFAYEDRSVAASSYTYFTVKVPFMQRTYILPLWLWLAIGALAVLESSGYMYYKKKQEKKKRFRVGVDYSSLPKEGPNSLFAGKLAETGIRAFIESNALQTHAMIAGSTGSGKTVAAMVLVEEALKKGINVLVFDPTAQWTGFMRKSKENFMLKNYGKFGMRKEDARAFNTQIKVIEDPYEYVDVKNLLKDKGKITVFVLNKLSSSQMEEFITSIIKQVFDAQLEESHELRTLMVFDEVHRLLTKFGATGKGTLAIERAAREFRKWGIGLILISQVLSDFVGETRANIGMEIQFRTRYEGDLERIRMKYGSNYVMSVVKAGVGTGMLVYSEYNKGRPYFIDFRPLLHQASRLSDKELEDYVKYDRKLEKIRRLVKILKDKNVDTFEIETELRLAEAKLSQGSFDMVDLYLESLEKTANKYIQKYKIKKSELETKKLSKKEVEAFMKKKEVKGEDLKIAVQQKLEEVKDKLQEAKNKNIDVFDLEPKVEVMSTKIRIASMENDKKTLKNIMDKLEKIEKEIRGREK